LSKGRNDPLATAFSRSQKHEKHLVFVVVNDLGKIGAELNKVRCGQLALEYGKLKVVAPSAHRLEHAAQALVIGDVVTNQVGISHAVTPLEIPCA
jgi:hypothetical protein